MDQSDILNTPETKLDFIHFLILKNHPLSFVFTSRSDGMILGRCFNANCFKLSVDALEILDESQFHRMRPFYTRILSSQLMARRSLLKEPVQFIPDRF